MWCHPSSGDRCGCSVCPLRHILGTPWGLCPCWVPPVVFLVLSHGLESWLHREPGKEAAQQLLGTGCGAAGGTPGSARHALDCSCSPAVSLLLLQMPMFQKFLHHSPHFILSSTASFGQTLCFCLLTNPVGITWILTFWSRRQEMLNVRPLSSKHFKDRWMFLILSVMNSQRQAKTYWADWALQGLLCFVFCIIVSEVTASGSSRDPRDQTANSWPKC